ncbi:MAG: phosphohydrolase [Thermodesulfovibrio sp.]|nr:phosphohydrolase [Thermodesulfovibrio sp.]
MSILIGIAVFFLEFERVKELVLPMALGEAEKLSEPYHSHFHQPGNQALGIVEAKFRTEFSRLHFVLAELYSRDKGLIVRQTIPAMADRVVALEASDHHSLMTDKVDYRRVYDKGDLFLKIVVPIRDSDDNRIIGFFEGIYLVTPETAHVIKSRIMTSVLLVFPVIFILTLVIYPIIIGLNKDLMRLSRDLYDANLGLLVVLGSAVAKRDSETNTHNYRVAIYSILLGEQMGLDNIEMQSLIKGAFLHDVGKIAIRDNLLHKAHKLTVDELEEMKTHVRHGVEILEKYAWLENSLDIVSCHHEKFDGSGYPDGLIGSNISLRTRIFSIVDVFDALTSKRPYKDAFPLEKAIEILQESSGSHFDPMILEKFLLICSRLYTDLNDADEEFLHTRMNNLISKYFEVS